MPIAYCVYAALLSRTKALGYICKYPIFANNWQYVALVVVYSVDCVVSIVVGVCNCSQMRTSKMYMFSLIFGVSRPIGLDPG